METTTEVTATTEVTTTAEMAAAAEPAKLTAMVKVMPTPVVSKLFGLLELFEGLDFFQLDIIMAMVIVVETMMRFSRTREA